MKTSPTPADNLGDVPPQSLRHPTSREAFEWGGIVAGAFFIIPSIFILWALSYVYVSFGTIPWIAAIFYGLKPAILAFIGMVHWRWDIVPVVLGAGSR